MQPSCRRRFQTWQVNRGNRLIFGVSCGEIERMKFEELHPELSPYLCDHAIHHPFVSWPYAFPAYYRRLNQCYLHNVQLRSGEKQPNKWDQYYPELPASDRMGKYVSDLFSDAIEHDDRFTNERLAFFGESWTSPDVIAQTSSFCEILTDHPFPRDVAAVMTESELRDWRDLPAEIDIHRASGAGNVHGTCWYLDRTVAAQWATIPYNGHLSSGRIRREFVRACFNRRGETELIVYHGRITNIKTEPHYTVDS